MGSLSLLPSKGLLKWGCKVVTQWEDLKMERHEKGTYELKTSTIAMRLLLHSMSPCSLQPIGLLEYRLWGMDEEARRWEAEIHWAFGISILALCDFFVVVVQKYTLVPIRKIMRIDYFCPSLSKSLIFLKNHILSPLLTSSMQFCWNSRSHYVYML